MAVKQVFETYVYAYLLSSSAKPPFVLGRICLIKGGDIFRGGLARNTAGSDSQADRGEAIASKPAPTDSSGVSVQQIQLQVFSHGLRRR